ncbi:LOW QUALITY PROTEIN: muscleblind-like protein 1 [Littorina saxatilis]|uniref:LOW QUALITY PROTEIN: muscleblind-like protein 1 n=1 Tax=Littorina saxatilis TaxID=31220 RepID=UPI0038B5A339
MAMVNTINPMTLNPNAKDSRWLTLEVCREYQRNKCTRTENECKFAHPPPHVEVQNGRVVACFDSIKGKCQRKDPPCKYLHPPQHLREQLLQNGRNNLILKSLHLQAALHHPQVVPGLIPMGASMKTVPPAGGKPMAYPTAVMPGQIPYVAAATSQSRPTHVSHPASFVSFATSSSATARAGPHYLSSVPTSAVHQYSPYGLPTVTMPGGDGTMVTQQMQGVISTPIPTKTRPDRLEVGRPTLSCSDYWVYGSQRVSDSGEAACEPPLSDSLLLGSHQVCREFQRGTCSRQPSDCRYAHPTENVTVDSGDNQVTVCMDFVKNKCTRDSCRYFHPPAHLQSQIKAAQQRANAAAPPSGSGGPPQGVPQQMLVPPYKRMAIDGSLGKSGIPMYQPTIQTSPYQQATLMHLQQQPYIPSHIAEKSCPKPTQTIFHKLLDTLPLCRDFRAGLCDRPTCRMVHVLEDVETTEDGRVVVCRDSVRNACKRALCKYYHIPVPLPPST